MLAIDHLVIATTQPEKAAKEFAEEYGVEVIAGGKHENWGTYNYLAFFQNNTYIEWLGVFDEGLARKSDNPLVKQAVEFLKHKDYGIVSYALRTNEMDIFITHLETNRLSYVGPLPGERKKTDGSTLSWRMLFPTQDESLPFLIEWGNGINLPADESKINTQQLNAVKVPGSAQYYQDNFKLNAEGQIIELENGKLIFTEGSQYDFELGK